MLFDDALSEMDAVRRHRLLEKSMRYEQVLITTTDLEQVNDFFGSAANYLHVFGGHVWASDEHGNVAELPVSGDVDQEDDELAIDESA